MGLSSIGVVLSSLMSGSEFHRNGAEFTGELYWVSWGVVLSSLGVVLSSLGVVLSSLGNGAAFLREWC